jgi:hypothetical protein
VPGALALQPKRSWLVLAVFAVGVALAFFRQHSRHAGISPQTNSVTELRWRDRTGKPLGPLGAPGEYYTPRISPDGRRLAFSRRDGNNSDIWVANPDANSFTRLTFDRAINAGRFPTEEG